MHTPRPLLFGFLLLLAGCGDEGATALPELVPEPTPVSVTAPRRVDFDVGLIGAFSTRTLAVVNPGSGPVSVQASGVPVCPSNEVFCMTAATHTIEAAAEATLELQFRPREARSYRLDDFTLATCEARSCRTTVELWGVGLRTGLSCAEPAVIGPVAIGRTGQGSVRCENRGPVPIRILPEIMSSDFALSSGDPVVVEPGGEAQIPYGFTPAQLDDVEAQLTLTVEEGPLDLRIERVVLRGRAGGPRLAPVQGSLRFGPTSLLAPRTREVQLANLGFEPLQVQARTEAPFSAQSSTFVLEPGGSDSVQVTFAPTLEGPVRGQLVLETNEIGAEPTTVELEGVGVRLEPCMLAEVEPVDFGSSLPGRVIEREVGLHNPGTATCLVYETRVSGDPSFRLVSAPTSIEGGRTGIVRVRFEATRPGAYGGQVSLTASGPGTPSAELRAQVDPVDSPFRVVFAPTHVDFGVVEPRCRPDAQQVRLRNPGDSVELRSIRVSEGFSVIDGVIPPAELPAGGTAAFNLAFVEARLGSHRGTFEVELGIGAESRTFVLELAGEVAASPRPERRVQFPQVDRADATDVLLVLDKTGCTGAERNDLAANYGAFIEFAKDLGLDYRIGVTTTDTDDEGGRITSSELDSSSSSRLDGPEAARVITEATPSADLQFIANTSFTMTGGGAVDESGLLAATMAVQGPAAFATNSALFRPAARLSVLAMSDEPDQSPADPDFYVDVLRSVGGRDGKNRVSFSALAAPPPANNCTGPAGAANGLGRYAASAEATGGGFASICTTDWTETVARISRPVFGLQRTFFLDDQPEPSTLEVAIDGRVVSEGWRFTAPDKALRFDPLSVPEAGSTVEVRYRTRCE